MSAPDVIGALVLAHPASLFSDGSVLVGQQAAPATATHPLARVFIVGELDRGATGRGRDSSILTTVAVAGETHAYSTGDRFTPLDNADVSTITALAASAYVGTPPFVEDRDYALGDSSSSLEATLEATLDAIEWLDTALVLPADGATVTVDYDRNAVDERHHVVRTYVARTVIEADGDATGPAASEAQRLGLQFRTWLEAKAGTNIQHDPDGHPIILGRPTAPGRSTGPDPGMSVATWSVDYSVTTGLDLDLGQVRRVRRMSPDVQVDASL